MHYCCKQARDLTPEEADELCKIGVQEMALICAIHASSQFDEFKIEPPLSQDFDDNEKRCRHAGAAVAEMVGQITDADVAGDVGKKVASGGMMGSLIGEMAAAADKAIDVAAAAGGGALKLAFDTMADAILKAKEELAKPFTEVGRDILKAKDKEVKEVLCNYINKYPFPTPFMLCRDPLLGSKRISQVLVVSAVRDLAPPLLSVVQEEINKHAVTKAWDMAIEKTNAFINLLQEKAPDLMERYGPTPIKLDINNYIVTKVIEKILELMAEKEVAVRASPSSQCTNQANEKPFVAIFSDIQLTTDHQVKERT